MKSMTGIFRDLHANRHAAAQAQMTWGVYGLTKSGHPYKTASARCASEDEARATAKEMTQLNGRTYIAQPL